MSWLSVTFLSSSSLLFPSHLTLSVSVQHLSFLNPSETISKYISIVPPLRECIQPLGLPITAFITALSRATRLEQVFINLIKILKGCKAQNVSLHFCFFLSSLFDTFIDKIVRRRQKIRTKERTGVGMMQARFKLASFKWAPHHLIVLRFSFLALNQIVQTKKNILVSFTPSTLTSVQTWPSFFCVTQKKIFKDKSLLR